MPVLFNAFATLSLAANAKGPLPTADVLTTNTPTSSCNERAYHKRRCFENKQKVFEHYSSTCECGESRLGRLKIKCPG
ncbi:MAG: hypothetical protein WAM14_24970 [Candidatus Nitrosopolaris sp.]